jgi:hypothetical protein
MVYFAAVLNETTQTKEIKR